MKIDEQNVVDKEKGVFRVMGICFKEGASAQEIQNVIDDVNSVPVLEPALMTRDALCAYMNAPEYVNNRMKEMKVESTFIYQNSLIKRVSKYTYNAKHVEHVEKRK